MSRTAARVGSRVAGVLLALAAGIGLAAPANLIQNGGDFEKGLDPWVTYGNCQMALGKKADAFEGSGVAFVTVPAKGANFWDAGVQYRPNITFKKNTLYTWAMLFKAPEPKRINIKPELGVDPWTGYGEKMVTVTQDWQEYWTEWQTAIDVVPASLTLHVQDSAINFWMDAVRWYEGKFEPYKKDGAPKAVSPTAKVAVRWADLKAR
jgi:hypothetical protein